MKVLKRLQTGRFLAFTVIILLAVVAGSWGFVSIVYADEVPTAPYTLQTGYLDFSYGADVASDHTATRPESKLWWNDGFWWANMWNDTADRYHIYRLDWGTQTWEDTGVALDARPESRADVLWDEDGQKLYVASYFQYDNPSVVSDPVNWARLYRLSYHEATESYTLDSDFPVTINQDKTNSLVLTQDDDGTLWATYVSRPHSSDTYQVYVNASDGDDQSWQTPFSLNDIFSEASVAIDDLSSIVAFNGTVGVMWTNQLSGTLNFALHDPTELMDSGWTYEPISITGQIDDHLSLKANSAGQLFAAIKTSYEIEDTGQPLIAMVTRDIGGQFAFHEYSAAQDNDTRPTLLIDEGNDQVYMFVSGKPGGSQICYKTAAITNPLSNMSFAPGDCGTNFIADPTYDRFDSATTSKDVVNDTTGLVVLASEDHNGNVYAHNVIGDPPPVITNRSPGSGATNVPLDTTVTATFSKNMDPATMTAANITLESSSGPVAGSVSYNPNTRTATFTPDELLQADSEYTLTVTTGVQDIGGQALFEAETWTFTTGDELMGARSLIYMPVMVKP